MALPSQIIALRIIPYWPRRFGQPETKIIWTGGGRANKSGVAASRESAVDNASAGNSTGVLRPLCGTATSNVVRWLCPHGGAVTEISRGLSGSDTPGHAPWEQCIPEGCQNHSPAYWMGNVLASLQDAAFLRTIPGVSANLNPRLMSCNLSGCGWLIPGVFLRDPACGTALP
jgi:hypothetical protein